MVDLHVMSNVDTLYKRIMLQLLCLMYDSKLMHERVRTQITRTTNKYLFELKRVNLDLYSRSPII